MKRISLFLYFVLVVAVLAVTVRKIYFSPQLNQRHLFVRAEHALQKGDMAKFERLKSQLTNYPLYPYLVYDDLKQRLNTLPQNEVDNFFKQYSDTAATTELRTQWLIALASQQQWSQFLKYYQHTNNAQLQCLYAQALYQTGKPLKAYQLGAQLWMIPKSQVSDCDPVFDVMRTNGALSEDLIWQRFLLTIQHGKIDFARILAKQLPDNKQSLAKRWLIVKQNSNQIMNADLFPDNTNKYNAIIGYGLEKMATSNPKLAVSSWHKLKKQRKFTHAQVQNIIQAIAIGYIKSTHQQAIPWLEQINPKYLNNIAMNWRLRFALETHNWRGLLHWINTLPIKERKQSEWRYWKAQALMHVGKKSEATKVLKKLATKRDYYGFMAAAKLNLPYPIHNVQLPISDADAKRVKNYPGFLRTQELFALNRQQEGMNEWWHFLKNLPESERYIATRLANQQGWYYVALASTGFIAHQDDLQLRFPQFYLPLVEKHANSYNLQPSFIYAIMRQESMFRPDVESYAGAVGLMQLMPATANMLIQQDNLPRVYSKKLKDPMVNIRLGSQYLNRLMASKQQSIALTAASYNAGPGRVHSWLPQENAIPGDIWIDTIPYPETRNYVKNVITYAIIYQYLMGNEPDINTMMPAVKADK